MADSLSDSGEVECEGEDRVLVSGKLLLNRVLKVHLLT